MAVVRSAQQPRFKTTRFLERARLGGGLWIASVVIYVAVQLIAVSRWEIPYQFSRHTISDLGVTTCFTEQRANGMIESCSPLHTVFNGGGTLAYVLLLCGGFSLYTFLGRSKVLAGLIALTSVGGIGVSLIPGDINLAAHTWFAIALFLGGIALLIVAAFALRQSRRLIAVSAAIAALLSSVGIVWFVATAVFGGPMGLAERLGSEIVYLWILAVGLIALYGSPRHKAHHYPIHKDKRG